MKSFTTILLISTILTIPVPNDTVGNVLSLLTNEASSPATLSIVDDITHNNINKPNNSNKGKVIVEEIQEIEEVSGKKTTPKNNNSMRSKKYHSNDYGRDYGHNNYKHNYGHDNYGHDNYDYNNDYNSGYDNYNNGDYSRKGNNYNNRYNDNYNNY